MTSLATAGTSYYSPDIDSLKRLSVEAVASPTEVEQILSSKSGRRLSLDELAILMNTLLSEDSALAGRAIMAAGEKVRRDLFGSLVVPMAPVEVSNTCASDCLFCGWRVSNRAMKRLRMPADLAMMQVEYLVDMGIHYIEFVSGDDISIVRHLLPDLITQTRALFEKRGIKGKISFCTLALTEAQYHDFKALGVDNMIVWQEAYDSAVFDSHIKGGPKAFGITDDWKVDRSGNGCEFRIQSQERAMRAGLEVGLGSMLGLNPDVTTEFIATVDHARYLADHYDVSPEHPIIIGMPIWNAITTRETDLRPAERLDINRLFPALSALYLLALPDRSTWVFPNCRVPLKTQIEAAKVAGAFSSTEVKLGPGGYLPDVIRKMRAQGEDTSELENRIYAMLKEGGGDIAELRRLLDEREQFVHHYHAHESYCAAMQAEGLTLASDPYVPAP